jgi:putative CocE/NonD family hydrolase
VPGPAIGFLQEAVRWWDHWLRGVYTGIMDEPPLRVWMQENVAPLPYYDERPGRWVAEEAWPSPRVRERTLRVEAGGLVAPSDPLGPAEVLSFASPQTTGRAAGEWCGFGAEGEMPPDQRPDDGRSLAFDSAPLAERLEILGAPAVELEIAADAPAALLVLRLCAVQPDGVSSLVSYGVLNLTHREGHEWPEPLEPGTFYPVRVQLNDIAHAFPAGSRIRLALSTAYWPIV